MNKILIMIALAFVISSCKEIEPKESTYKVGQTVVHKLSGYQGSIINIWSGCYKVGGDCRYYVRFYTPDKVKPFFTMEAREFEIEALDSLR